MIFSRLVFRDVSLTDSGCNFSGNGERFYWHYFLSGIREHFMVTSAKMAAHCIAFRKMAKCDWDLTGCVWPDPTRFQYAWERNKNKLLRCPRSVAGPPWVSPNVVFFFHFSVKHSNQNNSTSEKRNRFSSITRVTAETLQSKYGTKLVRSVSARLACSWRNVRYEQRAHEFGNASSWQCFSPSLLTFWTFFILFGPAGSTMTKKASCGRTDTYGWKDTLPRERHGDGRRYEFSAYVCEALTRMCNYPTN